MNDFDLNKNEEVDTAPVSEAQVAEPEAVAVPNPIPNPVVEKPKSKYKVPVAVTLEDIEAAAPPPPAGPAVVSNNTVDDVSLAAVVYKNIYARKSLTVHHLQRRLVELGYADALKDKDGWYGDHTVNAVTNFQKVNKVGKEGTLDAKTFLAIFKGDPNVNPIV